MTSRHHWAALAGAPDESSGGPAGRPLKAIAPDLAQAIEASGTARDLWYDDVHGAPDWRRHVSLRLAEEIRRELATEDACN